MPDDNRQDRTKESSAPRSSPGTDPTNPNRQESTGEWVRAEQVNEQRNDEPGLTDQDRLERDPGPGTGGR